MPQAHRAAPLCHWGKAEPKGPGAGGPFPEVAAVSSPTLLFCLFPAKCSGLMTVSDDLYKTEMEQDSLQVSATWLAPGNGFVSNGSSKSCCFCHDRRWQEGCSVPHHTKHSSACLPHLDPCRAGECRGKRRNPWEKTPWTNVKCWEVWARIRNKTQINSFHLDVKLPVLYLHDTWDFHAGTWDFGRRISLLDQAETWLTYSTSIKKSLCNGELPYRTFFMSALLLFWLKKSL